MIRLAGREHHGFQHICYQWKEIGSVITKSQTFTQYSSNVGGMWSANLRSQELLTSEHKIRRKSQIFAEYSSNVEEMWSANSRITNLRKLQRFVFYSYFVKVCWERFCILDT